MYHQVAALGATLLADPKPSHLAIAFVIRIIILGLVVSGGTYLIRRYRKNHPQK